MKKYKLFNKFCVRTINIKCNCKLKRSLSSKQYLRALYLSEVTRTINIKCNCKLKWSLSSKKFLAAMVRPTEPANGC